MEKIQRRLTCCFPICYHSQSIAVAQATTCLSFVVIRYADNTRIYGLYDILCNNLKTPVDNRISLLFLFLEQVKLIPRPGPDLRYLKTTFFTQQFIPQNLHCVTVIFVSAKCFCLPSSTPNIQCLSFVIKDNLAKFNLNTGLQFTLINIPRKDFHSV